MSILTKATRGIAYGDVSNDAVRNILTEISKSMNGPFTENDMIETLEEFGWRCPYTGKDLSYLQHCDDLKDNAADHICPQNREWCGLNVKGNLIIVDKKANAAKSSLDIETFLLKDKKVITDIDEIGRTRQERLQLIKDFQKKCNYDPNKIRKIISPLLEERYNEVRKQQEDAINNALNELNKNGIDLVSTKVLPQRKKNSSKNFVTQLVFSPSDENQFINEFLKKKEASIILTYDTGAVKKSVWKCGAFDHKSNLKANIQSRPFWRRRSQEGLVKVEVIIN